jgi:hypothetical protein
MTVLSDVMTQLRGLAPLLAALYVPAAFLLLGSAVVAYRRRLSFGMFTRDPTTILYVNPLIGVLSNLGVLAWCAAAAVCLFTWGVTRRRAGGRLGDLFLLIPGLLTVLLTLDDRFEIHETLFPRYVGGPDDALILVYVVVSIAWVVVYRRRILETEYALLLLALALLAVSVGVDALTEAPYSTRYIIEDGFKFLGAVGWLGYFGRVCFRELTGP